MNILEYLKSIKGTCSYFDILCSKCNLPYSPGCVFKEKRKYKFTYNRK